MSFMITGSNSVVGKAIIIALFITAITSDMMAHAHTEKEEKHY